MERNLISKMTVAVQTLSEMHASRLPPSEPVGKEYKLMRDLCSRGRTAEYSRGFFGIEYKKSLNTKEEHKAKNLFYFQTQSEDALVQRVCIFPRARDAKETSIKLATITRTIQHVFKKLGVLDDGEKIKIAVPAPKEDDDDEMEDVKEAVEEKSERIKNMRITMQIVHNYGTKPISIQVRQRVDAIKKFHPQLVRLEFWSIQDLLYNVSKHQLVPKHEPVDDYSELIRMYGRNFMEKLPTLLTSDAVAKFYAFKPGQVIRIARFNPRTHVTKETYRRVDEHYISK